VNGFDGLDNAIQFNRPTIKLSDSLRQSTFKLGQVSYKKLKVKGHRCTNFANICKVLLVSMLYVAETVSVVNNEVDLLRYSIVDVWYLLSTK